MSFAGWVTKSGNSVRSWKRRWMVLHNLVITYYPKKGAPPKGSFTLDADVHAHELEHKRSPHMFGVSTRARTFVMYAETADERSAWIHAINEAAASIVVQQQQHQHSGHRRSSAAGGGAVAGGGAGAAGGGGPRKYVKKLTIGRAGSNKSPRGSRSRTIFRRTLDDFLGLSPHLSADQLAVLQCWKRMLICAPSTTRILLYERANQGHFEMLSEMSTDAAYRMSEFLYIVDTDQAELDLLDTFGFKFNPQQLGIWLRVSQLGGLDGGWSMEFPRDATIDLNEVLALVGEEQVPAGLAQWAHLWGLSAFVTKITRDTGAHAPRKLYITFEFPGGKIAAGCISAACALIPSGVVESDRGIMRMAEARGIQVGWTCHCAEGSGEKPSVFEVCLMFEQDEQVMQLLSEDFSGRLYRAGVVEWSVEEIEE